MTPYCHMGKMCLGCSPQLIEGICPDSRAGRIVAELVKALQEVFADHAAAEREACAKVCDAVQKKNEDDGAWMWEARNCAAAIRARGEK